MNRVAGWRFLEIGRRLERGVNTCRLVRQFGMEQARATDFDVLLDLIDLQITYRSRYLVGVALYPVRDMALLDPYQSALGRLPDAAAARAYRQPAGAQTGRHAGAAQAHRHRTQRRSATTIAACVSAEFVLSVERRLHGLADAIAIRYFLQGPMRRRPKSRWDSRDLRHSPRHDLTYDAPVAYSLCALRLLPTSRTGQRVIDVQIDIDPPAAQARPAHLIFRQSSFDIVHIEAEHRELTVAARARIAVARPRAARRSTPDWEEVRAGGVQRQRPRPEIAGAFHLCQPHRHAR